MNLYWLYDIPTWLFALLVIGLCVAIALVGQRLMQRFVKRVAGKEGKYNELVGTTLATVGVFFGITLGLISVGTWQNYADVTTNVKKSLRWVCYIAASASIRNL
jgi:RsiW-degrading membrane proteinase PrsW (M82 family)